MSELTLASLTGMSDENMQNAVIMNDITIHKPLANRHIRHEEQKLLGLRRNSRSYRIGKY